MNIFVLHRSPRVSAQYHCNKHVVKMILETAQLLYSVHWTIGTTLPETAYKLAHKNHPCSIWARTSLQNYIWLAHLGYWLCREYTYRYGKIHKTESHLDWLIEHLPNIPSIGLTQFALAMPEQYKREDAVESYRIFYLESKLKERNIVQYKYRNPPKWIMKVLS